MGAIYVRSQSTLHEPNVRFRPKADISAWIRGCAERCPPQGFKGFKVDGEAPGMTEEVIAHMRARIARTRRVISLAHAEEMIAALEAMIEEAEADIRRLEEMAARDSSEGQSAEPFLLTPERPAD